jgi:hypothetical protein
VRIVPRLRSKVAFGRLNLMDESLSVETGYRRDLLPQHPDLFRQTNPGQGAERLCNHLAPGGYLFLGHSESIVGIDLPSSRSPTRFSRSDEPMPIQKIRVLIIDDSATVRQTLASVLESDPQIEVIGVASDPFVAAKRIARRSPTSSPWTSRCRAWTASPSCAS